MACYSKKKYLKLAKGYFGKKKNCPKVMIPVVERSLHRQYIMRRLKRRVYKKTWIKTINTAVREHGLSYNRFIYGLNQSNITINRYILQQLCINEPYSFKSIVDEVLAQSGINTFKPKIEFESAIEKEYIQINPQPIDNTVDFNIYKKEKDSIRLLNKREIVDKDI